MLVSSSLALQSWTEGQLCWAPVHSYYYLSHTLQYEIAYHEWAYKII